MDYTPEEPMEKASRLFRNHKYAMAEDWFMLALDDLVKQHGKRSLECIHAYYMHSLASLYRVPIQFDDDPMNLVPLEGDYLSNTATKPVVKETFYGKRIEEEGLIILENCDHVESAWKELRFVWSILKKIPGNSMEKVDILSAQGEVAYRRGQLYPEFYYRAHPEKYYLKALTILKNLVEPDNQRIAHLNFKISVCLEDTSNTKAIAYCTEAISVCKTRLKRLIAETTSSSGTAATLTVPDLNQEPPSELGEDPALVRKKAERSTLIKLTSNLLLQLDALKKSVPSNPTPTDSQLKRLIAETTSSFGTAATLTVPDLNQEPPAELGEDPALVQNKAERSALIKLTKKIVFQLDALKKSVPSNPTPTDSQLKRLIAETTNSSRTDIEEQPAELGIQGSGQLPTDPASEERTPIKKPRVHNYFQ